jgi:hypothetical protein
MPSFLYRGAVTVEIIEVPAQGSGVYQFIVDGESAEDFGYTYDELYDAALKSGAIQTGDK